MNDLTTSSNGPPVDSRRRSLVIGASGFIGNAVWRRLPAELRLGTYYMNEESSLVKLDVRNLNETLRVVRDFKPNVIYLPAAMPSADACEVDPRSCVATTIAGTASTAIAAREVGAQLVYFSTDYVFDGQAGPYAEDDYPRPINVYGVAKLAAEELIRNTLDQSLILRLSSVYGYERRGKNFVMGIVNRLRRGEGVRVPQDQRGTPTYVEDLAQCAIALVELGQIGTIHAAGPETVARSEFARLIAKIFRLDGSLISAVSTEKLEQVAPRPLQAGLRTERIQDCLGSVFQVPEAGLRETEKLVNSSKKEPECQAS